MVYRNIVYWGGKRFGLEKMRLAGRVSVQWKKGQVTWY